MEIAHSIDDESSSLEEEEEEEVEEEKDHVPKDKKKSISIKEDNEHLLRKKLVHLNEDQRKSHGSDKTMSSKTFSYRCNLDNDRMARMLRSPSLDSLGSSFQCPSPNIAVRSMSFDFSRDENLTSLEAALFGEILREATDRLDLLRRTIPKDEKSPAKLPERVLARKKSRCDAADERRMFFPDDADHVPVVLSVGQKLLNDWNVVHNVFRKLACELQTKGSYECLCSEVNAITDHREKECNLEGNLKVWIDLAKRLRDLLESREKDFETEKQEYAGKIEKLAADIDSAYCVNTETLDYARRWERSKLEQQNLQQNAQEDKVMQEIQELDKAKRIDAIVSRELLDYLKHVINNNEAEVLAWTLRFNDELERREREINELQEKMDELQEFLEDSRVLQSQRQVVIDEYAEEQRKIQAEVDYWDDVNKAATLIQAIWRGYMVRHRLGHFADLMKKVKVKKKKKAKKTSEKAKKK